MNLSQETLEILTNFSEINASLMFRKGTQLTTIDPNQIILASAKITEELPVDFGIYDLREFLSLISLYKDGVDINFEDTYLTLAGLSNRSKITYRYTPETMIFTPPAKEPKFPSNDVELELTKDDLAWALKVASVTQAPIISFESDGSVVELKTLNPQNESGATQSLHLTEGNGAAYQILFKRENLKIVPDTYNLILSGKGVGKFIGPRVQYFIKAEKGSRFTPAE